jgi:nucleoside-diphosphate-sugar epimerase
METVILRPPLVYGPEVGANFRALLRLVESGLPLPLESVRNRRSLIARDNLVDAILAAIDSAGAGGRIFYVTDGAAISTPDLVRALARALNRPPRLAPFPPALLAMAAKRLGRADAAESLLGSLEIDDSAFRGATGWRPPVSQQDALALTASWYKAAKGST